MIDQKKLDIKLISVDLDGTLLDSHKRVSERNRNALLQCLERGIYVVPTTGRTADGIPELVKQIPGVRYYITTNGAVIGDFQENLIIADRRMDCELALEVMELAERYDVMYDPYIEGRGKSEARFLDRLAYYGMKNELRDLILKTRDRVPSIREYVRSIRKDVEKINFYFPNQEERSKARAELETWQGIVLSSSMPNNLEINALGATKGEGILRLAAHLGLTAEQTMACGDGENDVTMIECAGVGVVMGNADESLKALADFITKTNDDDGVAYAIETLILKGDL